VGLALVGYFAMQKLGGWEGLVEKADAELAKADIDPVSWWSFTGIGWVTIIALFIAATVHTPAASVYVNFSTSAKKENYLIPAFIIAGVLAALMPLLAGFVGIEALATYGAESGLSSYKTITQLATDTGPIIGGIALAAILAALISSGAPILLGSATMFVNDWIPGSKDYSEEKKLRAYKVTAVIYGLFATSIASLGYISSVLQLLLLGFAMVVPPAIAIAYVFYWKRTTEKAAFYGIVSGFGGGLLVWGLNTLFEGVDNVDAGGLAQFWYELVQTLGEWSDPSFVTLLLPVVVIPVVVFLDRDSDEEDDLSRKFYGILGRIQANFTWSTENEAGETDSVQGATQ